MMVRASDGTGLQVTVMGEGRALLLIHGFLSSAQVNWITYGTAQKLADAGHRLILPDLRGHGGSDRHASFPPDVLRDDMMAVLDHFGIQDFDCAGYSLGARTALRLCLAGRLPARLALCGMGLAGLAHSTARRDWFIDVIQSRHAPRDAAGARVASFLKTMKVDPADAIAALQAQVETSLDAIRTLAMPAMVLNGRDDDDNGSGADLAALLPQGQFVEIPGNHMNAITQAGFADSLVRFFAEPTGG